MNFNIYSRMTKMKDFECEQIKKAVRILKHGGIVVFPTETVYGLGARLSDENAIKKIFAVKGRPFDNPLIVHISDKSQLRFLTKKVPAPAKQLMEKFWPGPLTLIFKRSSQVPSSVVNGLDTVAIRMPAHLVALQLLRSLKEPLAAPSANRSGRPSPTCYEDVQKELGTKVDLILNGGNSDLGLESTVLDVTCKPFRILRPGCITLEHLREVVPNVILNFSKSDNEISRSPGMKHRHYQPDCKVVLVRPEDFEKKVLRWKNKNVRLGVLSYSKKIPEQKNIVFKKYFHKNKNKYARNLYACFFEAEKTKVQVLLSETVDRKGVGTALLDRLNRASENGSR